MNMYKLVSIDFGYEMDNKNLALGPHLTCNAIDYSVTSCPIGVAEYLFCVLWPP